MHAKIPDTRVSTLIRLGCSFPFQVKEVNFEQTSIALNEAEILVVCPPSLPFNCLLAGKRSLSGNEAIDFLRRSERWRAEMQQALKVGKTIFVFCSEPQTAIGENPLKRSERLEYSNYRMIPIENVARILSPRRGRRTQLVSVRNYFRRFWNDFREYAEYRTYFRELDLKPLLRTGDGSTIIGGYLEFTNEDSPSGFLVFLPHLDLGEIPKRHALLEQHLLRIDKELRLSPSEESPPDWILGRFQHKAGIVKTEKEELLDLLYAKGSRLESAVRLAFRILGFTVEHYQSQDFEIDAILSSEAGRFLCEIEGKDSQSIGANKILQLSQNIVHDSRRTGVMGLAKGILCGNPFRLSRPETRKDFFSSECVALARKMQVALLRTPDLLPPVQYLLQGYDVEFAERCRRVICETEGDIVRFPSPPHIS